ncbi:uncharacterized protein LOC126318325 [Schistocerca gregaria]|uniref:uncharacterized protein LOC126318325 n=1 Tax=Schistocerca gregaria TaxID=7010 RepID=UPI00211DBD98|nr:uncharacterized protein LOC126318325 [Schistocerca gregaria]
MGQFFVWITVVVWLVALCSCANEGASIMSDDVVVIDKKLFVGGEEFWIKGMAYHPAPLGLSSMQEDGTGGAGLCSPKKTPWEEWMSACFDSDFFDGSGDDPERYPPGPESWFQEVWERDFPILKELGVNTLRIYSVNPTTREASIKLLSQNWNKIRVPFGKEHRKFLDLAEKFGFKVMFPLVSDEAALTLDSEEILDQKLRNLIDEVGDHPAVIMWVIGNELDLHTEKKSNLREKINAKMTMVREYMKKKWNRKIPVTSCVTDFPESYEYLAHNLNVDLFCANAGYRGTSYTELWEPKAKNNFIGWKALSEKTKLPLLIGELGWLSVNNSINYEIPNWFNLAYAEVLKNYDNGCIGITFFEYNDEPYKKSGKDQTQLGVVSFVPYVDSTTGKSSATTVDFFRADIAVKKPIIYNAVAFGSGVNMNTNVWNYLGKSPAKIVTQARPPYSRGDLASTSTEVPVSAEVVTAAPLTGLTRASNYGVSRSPFWVLFAAFAAFADLFCW